MSSRSAREPRLPVRQLAILSICRLAEPVASTGVFPYLPEMIESFNIPQNEVAKWAGITSASFSMSQCVTSISWGRASDRLGRKPVILFCLICSMATSLLFGFSKSLTWAIVARALSGAASGNVGILRTTVAELVPQKALQPRAFSIMPLVWSIGSIFGPILGGALASPAKRFPHLFGDIEFFRRFPFALPNLVAGIFFMFGVSVGFLFFKETLQSKKHNRDYGLVLGSLLTGLCTRKGRNSRRNGDDERAPPSRRQPLKAEVSQAPPGYREVFSPQSNINLLAYTLLALHAVTFDQLLPVFLHLPPQDHTSANSDVQLPFKFAGGFGLDSGRIGVLFTAFGIFCMVAQFTMFPPLASRFGVLYCLRVCTFVFPIAYLLTPFTVLFPTSALRQAAMFCVMLIKGIASVFSFPCVTILLTNSARSLRLLGTLNGVAVSLSAIGRASGPFISGRTFTWGVDVGYIITPWWTLAGFAILGHICTWWLIELEGFGKEDEPEEVENALPVAEEEQEEQEANTGQSTSIAVRDAAEDDEHEDDEYALEEDDPLLTMGRRLEKTSSRGEQLDPNSLSIPTRLSSPLGQQAPVGPGGRRLSNAIGQNMSGLGSGGTTFN